MTIKILATLAIAATLFTACGDESTSTPPTKAEQCATGLTSDCLLGTWSINGPTGATAVGNDIVYIIDPSHDLTSSPATVKFYIAEKNVKTFEFTHSSLSKAGCDLTKTYGTWELNGTALHLKATANTACIPERQYVEATITPEIAVSGAKVTMTFKQLFFMRPEYGGSASLDELQDKYEVYTFVSAE
jgi:hypothetical protein